MLKVVCIGDSLTYGYGVRESQSWVNLFRSNLNELVLNKGVNGDTTDGMLNRFHRDVISQKPTHAFILGGSNDLIMGSKMESFSLNMSSMVSLCTKSNISPILGIQPYMEPRMANLFWSEYTDFIEVNKEIKKYRDWVISYTKLNEIGYIDFNSVIEEGLSKYTKDEIYIDGVHLTPKGHELMASIIKI